MVKEFRPISCCTVIYKIISRILAARLGGILSSITHKSQAAFILGDTQSIQMVMEAFSNFSKSTGLKAYSAKCVVYFGNVDQQTRNEIQVITEFKEGPMPFRHLSIPLTSRKLSIGHCLLLCIPLSKTVRMVEAICRTFLWTGCEQISRKTPIAWHKAILKYREEVRHKQE
ncbi:uncharacterized protein LOC131658401 [Vicia villosa]|uniref:uncharacterized protein LOC131658401 n=1 Tax=Vicia villosa TaxID=3911 RepID=UPI00273B65EA|nr:uncharacterized protein LOC131658401 [Vicia villosa]